MHAEKDVSPLSQALINLKASIIKTNYKDPYVKAQSPECSHPEPYSKSSIPIEIIARLIRFITTNNTNNHINSLIKPDQKPGPSISIAPYLA